MPLFPTAVMSTQGEIAASSIVYWNHSTIKLVLPHGVGAADVVVYSAGQMQLQLSSGMFGPPSFAYSDPVVTAISPLVGTTLGGNVVTLTGYNFGVNASAISVNDVPLPLPATYQAPGLYSLRVNWGNTPWTLPISSLVPGGQCLVPTSNGTGISGCNVGVLGVTQTSISLIAPPGLGINQPISVSVISSVNANDPAPLPTPRVFASVNATPVLYSYRAPVIKQVTDASGVIPFVLLGPSRFVEVMITGYDLSSPSDSSSYSFPYPWMTLMIDGSTAGVSGVPVRALLPDGMLVDADGSEAVLAYITNVTTVGYHNVTVVVGGQSYTAVNALNVGCAPDFFGRPGEICIPCPLGGYCPGYSCPSGAPTCPLSARLHAYPAAMPGFFNLNSTDMTCPPDKNSTGRDGVCIVACFDTGTVGGSACLGDNLCATGYVSAAPSWRCDSCATSPVPYYAINTVCTPCPTGGGPFALVILFTLLVVSVGAIAYVLNKNAIRIGYVSIGLDYAQVVALFATAQAPWTKELKNIFLVLSALYLNVEIVAPECLPPVGNADFKDKFTTVMLLPIFIGGAFLSFHAALTFWKSVVLGRSKKLNRHVAPLIASLLLMMYVLYIYLCKITFDVFDCQPSPEPLADRVAQPAHPVATTVPMPEDRDSGGATLLYLQADKTPCTYVTSGYGSGLASTQAALVPIAAVSLIIYVVGYPVALAFFLWRKRDLIIEDQLLRAKGVGNDRLTNPDAYGMRRAFSGVYHLWKPDYYWWTTIILLRKFFIVR